MALAEELAEEWRTAAAAPDAERPPWVDVPLTEDELLAALVAGERGRGRSVARPATRRRGSRAAAVRLRGVAVTYNRGHPLRPPGARRGRPGRARGRRHGGDRPDGGGQEHPAAGDGRAPPGDRGTVAVFGAPSPAPGEVGMVFQRPEVQLYCATVAEDVGVAPRCAASARCAWTSGCGGRSRPWGWTTRPSRLGHPISSRSASSGGSRSRASSPWTRACSCWTSRAPGSIPRAAPAAAAAGRLGARTRAHAGLHLARRGRGGRTGGCVVVVGAGGILAAGPVDRGPCRDTELLDGAGLASSADCGPRRSSRRRAGRSRSGVRRRDGRPLRRPGWRRGCAPGRRDATSGGRGREPLADLAERGAVPARRYRRPSDRCPAEAPRGGGVPRHPVCRRAVGGPGSARGGAWRSAVRAGPGPPGVPVAGAATADRSCWC